jgi:hypothetical protein
MAYVYNYFVTDKIISVNILKKSVIDIFNYVYFTHHSKEYLMQSEYKKEIDEYIKKNNIIKYEDYFKKYKTLEFISDIYFEYLKNNNIELFVKNLIYTKDETNKMKYSIDNYFALQKNINYNIINNNKDISYNNPINYKILPSLLDKDFFVKSINKTIYNKETDKIFKCITILLTGNIINNSLPSIGLVKNYIDPSKTINKTIVEFIEQILNYNKDDNITKIPFLELDIGKTISSILLNIKDSENLDEENIFYDINKFNNTQMSNLIENMIDNIQINLNDIFLKKHNNKKIDKIKPEYIVPYKYDSTKKEIVQITKLDIEKYKTIDKLMDDNRKIVFHVINEVYKISPSSSSNLNKKNYKNVLASFLFVNILIIYDVLKHYIEHIDKILMELTNTKEKRFSILNIKDAFNYTNLLTNSLYKFKLILLNNFYNLFIPSTISKNNYGMERDINECYIPELNSVFLNTNEYIYSNYPFKEYDDTSTPKKFINIILNDFLSNFILNIKDKYDIYDKKYILEFGGYSFDKDTMKISTKIINEYFTLLQKYNNFVLFIIDKLIDNFMVKQNIPYELIDELNYKYPLITKKILTPSEEDQIKKYLLYNLNLNIEKSTNYYIKLLNIRNKKKQTKKNNINVLYNVEEIYKLCFKIYYIKASCIIQIVENIMQDLKVKNSIILDYLKIKKLNEKKIEKHMSLII